ncbi:MAG: hypothetical protein FWG90_13135, partial [Oscillospiraceae bacterium]|nr:hypothetical protein [Oscillospiraceae bacterium]
MNKSLFKRATAIAAASALALSATLIAPLFSSADDGYEDDAIYSPFSDVDPMFYTTAGLTNPITFSDSWAALVSGLEANGVGMVKYVASAQGDPVIYGYEIAYLGSAFTPASIFVGNGTDAPTAVTWDASQEPSFTAQRGLHSRSVAGIKDFNISQYRAVLTDVKISNLNARGRDGDSVKVSADNVTAGLRFKTAQTNEEVLIVGEARVTYSNGNGKIEVWDAELGTPAYVEHTGPANTWLEGTITHPIKVTLSPSADGEKETLNITFRPDLPEPEPSNEGGNGGGGGGGGDAVRDQIVSGGVIGGGGGGGTNNTESGGGGREVKVIADSAEAKTTVSNTTRGTVTL